MVVNSRFDFDEDEWQTEQASDQIQQTLDRLATTISKSRKVDSQLTLDLVSDGFRCSALRPSELTTIYDHGSIIVRRWIPKAPPESQALVQSSEGIAQAFRDWLVPLGDAGDVHAKFKITSIEASHEELATDVLVQLSGRLASEHRQLTSTWRCLWDFPPSGARLKKLLTLKYEEAQSRAEMADCTLAVMGQTVAFRDQLRFSLDYWLDRLENRFGIITTGYQGLAVGDANGDGLDDLFVAQPGGVVVGLPNRLFIQRADGTVEDVSVAAGVNWNLETHAALFLDLDNDGDQDLVVSTVMGVVFAENDGAGKFRPKSVKLVPEAPPMSLSACDFDHDGDLDVFACCYSNRITTAIMGRPLPYHDANNGGRNVLFRNDRDWRFQDVTRQVGLDENNRRFSFAAAWEDYDNDGDSDLYVANDYGRNNLYRNDEGEFVDVAAELGVEDISAGMSVSWGDYNLDGWMDLYVSNMWSSAGNRIAFQRRFKSAAGEETRQHYQRHARGNSLFFNPGSAGQFQFADVSLSAGVNMGRWAWASQFVDVNNDGYEDLFVVNGFITQADSSDL